MINSTKPVLREEFGQDQREDSKDNPRPILKLTSSSSKPITVMKPMSIKPLYYCNITIPYLTYKIVQDTRSLKILTLWQKRENIQTLKNL